MPPPCRLRSRLLLLLATLSAALVIEVSPALANEPAACPERSTSLRRQPAPRSGRVQRALGQAPLPQPDPYAPTYLRAEEIEALGRDKVRATGNVELIRPNQRLTSEELTYDRTTDVAYSPGPTTLENDLGDVFRTESLTLSLGTRIGDSGPGAYRLGSELGRGDAQSVSFEGEDLTRLKQTRFTTCRPGEADWYLKTAELELDHAEETGTAWHATLEFMGVPFFYFPYVSFPITDRRRSGFLFPELGNSDSLGVMLALPYYINIAPNLDDTLTPRYFSRRGLQLENEFRYLGRASRGQIDSTYLADDKETGTNRSAWKVVHTNGLGPHWSARIDAQRVSDDEYLDDFGGSLDITTQTHLAQTGQLLFRADRWRFLGEVTTYQTVDRTIPAINHPYAMLPNLVLQSDPLLRPNTLNFPSLLQWVKFDRDDGVTGARSYFNPAVSLPLRTSYAFLTPKLLAWHVRYDLEDSPVADPSVSVSGFSLDGGLLFDRRTQWFGRGYIQTLEPRLFYTYIPFKRQDDLPVFDSAVRDLSFPALFQENRFTGGDRIGDANQLALGLTTRLIDRERGMERLRLSLGEVFFADDRRVGLPGATGPETDDRSGVVAEAAAWLGGSWYSRAMVRFAPQHSDVEQGTLFVQYNPKPDRIASLGYSYAREQIEQLNTAFEWPLSARWRMRASQAYSLPEAQNIATYAGLEYASCCWALRLYGRRYRRSTGELENSVMLQLELIGLSKLGSAPRSPLEDSLFFPSKFLPGSGESTVRY